MLPRLGKVVGAENRVEDTCEEGNRSLGKMLQCPVRDSVRAKSLADLETPDGCVNLVKGGQLWFTGRALEVRPQRHVNYRFGHRLQLSLQTFCKGFGFLGV